MSQLKRMGRFTLLEPLGVGGSGEVHLAYTKLPNGVVQFFAVKILNAEQAQNPRAIKMLKKEASLANILKHNSIVSIDECGEEGNDFYIAMSFVNGVALSKYMHFCHINKKQIKIAYALYVVKSVASGLEYARLCKDPASGQDLNIVHRDISPQNILINFEGEIKIIDFGLARTSDWNEKTQSDQIMGKLKYISPEHARGEKVDHRTDIFSLGVVLWEMLAGRRFYKDLNDAGIVRWLQFPDYSSLLSLNDQVKPDLDALVKRACEGKVEERFQTAGDFHNAISIYLNQNFPQFTPQIFRDEIKNVFNKEMVEWEKKLAYYIAKLGVEIDPTQYQKKFDQYADLVDSLGVLQKPEKKRMPLNNVKVIGTSPDFNSETNSTWDLNLESKKTSLSFWNGWSSYEFRRGGGFFFKIILVGAILLGLWKHMNLFDLKVINMGWWSFHKRTPASTIMSLKYPMEPIAVQIRTRPSGAKIIQNGHPLSIQTPGVIEVRNEESANILLEVPGFAPRRVVIRPFEDSVFVDFNANAQ